MSHTIAKTPSTSRKAVVSTALALVTMAVPAAALTATPAHATAAASPAAAAKPLAGIRIAVDAGHNFGDHTNLAKLDAMAKAIHAPSCEGDGTYAPAHTIAGRYYEASMNWDVANKVKSKLEALGATVVMTRTNNTGFGPCITTRANTIAASNVSMAISLHADGNMTSSLRGYHVIYPDRAAGGARVDASSKLLATKVRDTLAYSGMPKSNYVGHGTALSPRHDLGLMNAAHVPTILVEAGNMKNATDDAMQRSDAWRDKEANLIVTGVRHYYNK